MKKVTDNSFKSSPLSFVHRLVNQMVVHSSDKGETDHTKKLFERGM